MSGAKSILEIDVKDEKWQAFQQEFGKYREAVKDLPGDWGNVGKATGALAPNFADMVRLLSIMADSLGNIEDHLAGCGNSAESIGCSSISMAD